MALPEIELHRVEKLLGAFCDQRIRPHVKHLVKLIYKISGNKVILIETRPYHFDPTKWTEMPIAQFEYNEVKGTWSLYGYGRHENRKPCSKGNLEKLIQDVDYDSTGIFWG